jgi:hypothetical protein
VVLPVLVSTAGVAGTVDMGVTKAVVEELGSTAGITNDAETATVEIMDGIEGIDVGVGGGKGSLGRSQGMGLTVVLTDGADGIDV